jgi:hypothetical protein
MIVIALGHWAQCKNAGIVDIAGRAQVGRIGSTRMARDGCWPSRLSLFCSVAFVRVIGGLLVLGAKEVIYFTTYSGQYIYDLSLVALTKVMADPYLSGLLPGPAYAKSNWTNK